MKFLLVFAFVFSGTSAALACTFVVPYFGDVTWPRPSAENIALSIAIDIQRTGYEEEEPALRLMTEENQSVSFSLDESDPRYLRLFPDEPLFANSSYTLIATQGDEARTLTTFTTGDAVDEEAPLSFDIAPPEHEVIQAGDSSLCAPPTREDRLTFHVPQSTLPDIDFVRGELFDAETDERVHSTLFTDDKDQYWSTLRYTIIERETRSFYIDFIDGSGNRTRSNTVSITPTGCSSLKVQSKTFPTSALIAFALIFLGGRQRRQKH